MIDVTTSEGKLGWSSLLSDAGLSQPKGNVRCEVDNETQSCIRPTCRIFQNILLAFWYDTNSAIDARQVLMQNIKERTSHIIVHLHSSRLSSLGSILGAVLINLQGLCERPWQFLIPRLSQGVNSAFEWIETLSFGLR